MSQPPQVVLLVENRHLSYVYEHLIEGAGAALTVISHLLEIKKWTRSNPLPQALVADTRLADKLIEILREEPQWQQVPVLVMTPTASPPEIARKTGHLECIPKPFDPQSFVMKLKWLLKTEGGTHVV